MKNYLKLWALVLSAVAFASLSNTYAQTSGTDLDLEISWWILTYHVDTGVNFWSIQSSFSQGVLTGTVDGDEAGFRVSDMRWTLSSWNWRVQMETDLTWTAGTIGMVNVEFNMAATYTSSWQVGVNVTVSTNAWTWESLDSSRVMLNLNDNNWKVFKVRFTPGLRVIIPANQPVGTYHGVMRVTTPW